MANLSCIYLRTGCFCNSGDCQKHLSLSVDEMLSNYREGHVCGDQIDVIGGRTTGSVRISFGYMSTFSDAQRFLTFLKESFIACDQPVVNEGHKSALVGSTDDHSCHYGNNSRVRGKSELGIGKITQSIDGMESLLNDNKFQHADLGCQLECNKTSLKRICLYPVKSCGGFEVS